MSFSDSKRSFHGWVEIQEKENEKKKARNFTDPTKGGAPPGKKPFKKKPSGKKQITINPDSLRKPTGNKPQAIQSIEEKEHSNSTKKQKKDSRQALHAQAAAPRHLVVALPVVER